MIKKLSLLVFSLTLIQNSNCLYGNYSAEVDHVLKEILGKWENKELELNVGCAQQLYQLLENMISFDDEFWAYKMIDATGKFPSGLAEGNFEIMGSFDECLNIRNEKKNITGNYCSITMDISGIDSILGPVFNTEQTESGLHTYYKKLTENQGGSMGGQPLDFLPMFGVCLPNKCSADDIKNALYLVTTLIPLNIRCNTKDEIIPPLDVGATVTIAILGIIIILLLFSTIYDYICQGKGTKPHKILIAFSTYTNGKKLFRLHSGREELLCLHGIRFFSMCWVMLGHVFLMNTVGPTVNLFDMLKFLTTKTESMLYLNCAHAVDSFFVLSGLLVAYNFMKKMKKEEKFNIFKYYLHRYLRLTPAYAAAIFSTMYLLKYLGSGPLYYQIDSVIAKTCRDHWWKALLYLQNYLAVDADLCIGQSWNLSIDWQLYLLSPIFLFVLYRRPKLGTMFTILPIVGCMIASFVITHQEHLTTLLGTVDMIKFFKYYYNKTHTRAATWFIGALLGYVLGRIKFYNDTSYLRIPRAMVLIIWLIVLAVMPVCIFAGHDMVTNENYDVIKNSFYNTFVRPTWALCVSWIIFACTVGYGGIINNFLSLPIFGVLSKFTYSMYLLHLTILNMMICSRKIPAFFSVPELMNQFCALFGVSFIVATFWILAFEMPVLVIEPHLFGNWGIFKKKISDI